LPEGHAQWYVGGLRLRGETFKERGAYEDLKARADGVVSFLSRREATGAESFPERGSGGA